MILTPGRRCFARIAFACVGAHALALLGTFLLIEPGLPPGPRGPAWEWTRSHPLRWQVGLGLWLAASATLPPFIWSWARQVRRGEPEPGKPIFSGAALCLVLAGLSAFLPEVVALLERPPSPDTLEGLLPEASARIELERRALVRLVGVGNLAVTAAALVCAALSLREGSFPSRRLLHASWPIWAAGVGASAATFTGRPAWADALFRLEVLGFTAFAAGLALEARSG